MVIIMIRSYIFGSCQLECKAINRNVSPLHYMVFGEHFASIVPNQYFIVGQSTIELSV